jgi:hypothetical protein
VSCGDVIGAYGNRTDDNGRFVVEPVYANADTLFSPHPPRAADGTFLVSCTINAEVRRDVVARDSMVIPFVPTQVDVTSTLIELREPGP